MRRRGASGAKVHGPRPVPGPMQTPDDGNGEADVRQVGVAIGPGVFSDLHQADGGHERAEKPEPADKQGGLPAARQEGGQGDGSQEEQPAADLPRRVVFRLRIKSRQPAGPKELAKIDAVGNRGVGDPRGKGDVIQGAMLPAWLRTAATQHAPLRKKSGTFSSTSSQGDSRAADAPRSLLPDPLRVPRRLPATVPAASSPGAGAERGVSPAWALPRAPG